MRQFFKTLSNIIFIIVVGYVAYHAWQAYTQPQLNFEYKTWYKQHVEDKPISLAWWGRGLGCQIRFDYSFKDTVEKQRADKLKKWLEKALPCDSGIWQRIVVDKIADGYLVYWPLQEGVDFTDMQYRTGARDIAFELSARVFDANPVVVILCDSFFNRRVTVATFD